MEVKSNIEMIRAWKVDLSKVREYFEKETVEVDFDEYKKYPSRLVLRGGSVCHDGDYILRYERSDSSQPKQKYVFYQRKLKKNFQMNITLYKKGLNLAPFLFRKYL